MPINPITITVNSLQIKYEFEHLQRKLFVRDNKKFEENLKLKKIVPHPLFKITKGEIEDWEIVK